jgi:hypothetical protein
VVAVKARPDAGEFGVIGGGYHGHADNHSKPAIITGRIRPVIGFADRLTLSLISIKVVDPIEAKQCNYRGAMVSVLPTAWPISRIPGQPVQLF